MFFMEEHIKYVQNDKNLVQRHIKYVFHKRTGKNLGFPEKV